MPAPETPLQIGVPAGEGLDAPLAAIRRRLEAQGIDSEFVRFGLAAPPAELWRSLIAGTIDLVITAFDRWPSRFESGLVRVAVCGRADPRDALICEVPTTWSALPPGARLQVHGAARLAQLRRARPDLEILDLADPAPSSPVAGSILPLATLTGPFPAGRTVEGLPIALLLPGAGQGVIAAVSRAGESDARARLREALHDSAASACLAAEGGFVSGLCAGEGMPVAALATWDGTGGESGRWMELTGRVLTPDGTLMLEGVASERIEDETQAEELGRALAADLITQGALDLLGNPEPD